MTDSAITTLTSDHPHWPQQLKDRLGEQCPLCLTALGNPALLAAPLTALFCSAHCPGDAILRAYDQAAQWRDTGRAVIGGFHSPMEKDCLRILLRGPQPIVVCPARGLPVRLAPELLGPITTGRLLMLTPFPESERRVTHELAAQRNYFVAALAADVWFAHITPGGQMENLAKAIGCWSPASTPSPNPSSRTSSAPFPSSPRP